MNTFLWLILALLFDKCASLNLTYNDPLIKTAGCFPDDSCLQKTIQNASRLVRLLDEFKNRACFCDKKCLEFGDCCIDSIHLKDAKPDQNNGQVCVELKNYGGVYMVDKCPPQWDDADIKESCENFDSLKIRSPLALMPVSDVEDGTTFKNFFCAVCHGRNNPDNVRMWHSRVECLSWEGRSRAKGPEVVNLTDTFFNRNIHYNKTVNYWGVMVNSSFVRCNIDPFMPDNLDHKIRRCRVVTADCPDDWEDDDVREKCASYSGTVAPLGDTKFSFKNMHCAVCHGLTPKDMTCVTRGAPINGRDNKHKSFSNTPFTLLLDFNANDGQYVGIVNRCGRNEVYDPFFKKCRNVICGHENSVFQNGRCRSSVDDAGRIGVGTRDRSGDIDPKVFDGQELPNNTYVNNTEHSIADCPRWTVDKKHVLVLKNGSIFIMTYDTVFAPGDFFVTSDSHFSICALESTPGETKFSDDMTIISFVGLGISLVCLILHFIAFMLVPDLQNLSGKNLACLVLSLFVAYLTFILGMFIEPGSLSCFVTAVVMYYSFLATFFWMNVISGDVWQTLRMATTELRVSGGRQLRKFICYSFYAWLFPGFCVTIAVLFDYSIIEVPEEYTPAFGVRNCWFGHRMALAVLFGGPAGVLLIFNIIFFVLSTSIIIWSTRSSSKFDGPTSNSKRNYKLYLRLAVICGLTWIWGFIAGFFNTEPLWYVFIFFNTLIGLFIFMTFTCTKKVGLALRSRIKCLGQTTKRAELFNISASSGSNLNSNETRKSTLIPTDSGGSQNSEKYDGMYNPLAAYRSNSTTLY